MPHFFKRYLYCLTLYTNQSVDIGTRSKSTERERGRGDVKMQANLPGFKLINIFHSLRNLFKGLFLIDIHPRDDVLVALPSLKEWNIKEEVWDVRFLSFHDEWAALKVGSVEGG